MSVRDVLVNAGHQLTNQGLPSTLHTLFQRAQVRWNEWRYRIRTEGYIELSEYGIYNEECKHYGATSYADFARIMGSLDIDPREHVRPDYWAGMGRVKSTSATL